MILLNTNFEELIIKENSKYYIFNSNATSFRLPKLNNLNITESAYLKNLFFGGEFVFLNEFPNFEFNSVQNINNYEFDFDIEYFLEILHKKLLHYLIQKLIIIFNTIHLIKLTV